MVKTGEEDEDEGGTMEFSTECDMLMESSKRTLCLHLFKVWGRSEVVGLWG